MLVDDLKESFLKEVKKHVGDKYASLFDENRVVSKQSIDEAAKSSKNTLFLGYTGTGKTMAMIYLAWKRYCAFELNRGSKLKTQADCWLPHYRINWFHCVELCRLIQNQAKNNYAHFQHDEIYIDDFGLFSLKPWEQADLEYWFECLYKKKVVIHITTNLTVDQLKEDCYARILSRIRQNCLILNFGQKDQRVVKNAE